MGPEHKRFPLFTSIPPKLDFRPFITNWEAAGFQPISINIRAEAQELRSLSLDVVEVNDTNPKLSLRNVLDAIRRTAPQYACLINADCRFVQGFNAENLGNTLSGRFVLAERIDVDQFGRPTPYLPSGFDAMFFDIGTINSLDPHPDFRIGTPWWDYWLPTAVARKKDHVVGRFDCPILWHTAHDSQWDDVVWKHNAELFMSDFGISERDPIKVSADIFQELLRVELVPSSGLPRDTRLYLAYIQTCLRENDHLKRQLQLIRSSRAYKATEPIRKLSRLVRFGWS